MRLESELLDNKVLKITLDGRLDIEGANEIDMQFTALTATKKAAVIVDMGKVGFLASIGIRTLLSSAKACAKRGGQMVVFDPQPMVRDVLESSGVSTLIPVFDDEPSARAAVAHIAPD
jgi:anti-sigma B factor antagonist